MVPAKFPVTAWLLACPALLVVAVFVLPQLKQLYGTQSERFVSLVLMALPLIGVVGIFRYKQFTLGVRLLFCVCYLLAGLILAAFAVIFVGCSWAGACFYLPASSGCSPHI